MADKWISEWKLQKDDGTYATGWYQKNNQWYYFDGDGVMMIGWLFDDGNWYYLNKDGTMATGWKKINDKWYYFNPVSNGTKGRMYTKGKYKIDNKWYSFNLNGSMVEEIVTMEQMKSIGWNLSDKELSELNNCLVLFEINTPKRLCHFISQISHESGCGKFKEELADGSAYEYRTDLGNVNAGDGKKYKGAGYIQLTGRSNYYQFSVYMNDSKIMNGASYVAKNYPAISAGYWWFKNNMNYLCDIDYTVEQITKRVNGGYNGLADRKMYYERCQKVFK